MANEDLRGTLGLLTIPESQERRAVELPRAIALVDTLLTEAKQELATADLDLLRVEGSLTSSKRAQRLSDQKIKMAMATEAAWVAKKKEVIELTAAVQQLEGYRRALMEESRLLQAVFGFVKHQQRNRIP